MDIKSLIKKNLILNWIYKIQKIYKNKKPNFHYGEFAEDIFINRVFKNLKSGFYIDIGAYHPFKGSLTFLLFQKGWRGLNIDLSEDSIELFKIARPNDLNVNCAITNFSGETIYYQNSEINQQNSLIKRNNHQKEIKVNAFTLNDLLKKKNVTISIRKKAKEILINEGNHREWGARPLRRVIQNQLENVIAEKFLTGDFSENGRIIVSTKKNHLVFRFEKNKLKTNELKHM